MSIKKSLENRILYLYSGGRKQSKCTQNITYLYVVDNRLRIFLNSSLSSNKLKKFAVFLAVIVECITENPDLLLKNIYNIHDTVKL